MLFTGWMYNNLFRYNNLVRHYNASQAWSFQNLTIVLKNI